jgi:D-aspartate ligase
VIDTSVPVAVIDRDGYEGVSIARSLGRMGVPMYLVGQEGISTPGWSSRYWAEKVRWNFSLPEEDSVAFLLDFGLRIRAKHGARPILLTQKDWLAIFVERNSRILQEQFLFPQPARPIIRSLLNKWQMHLLAEEHGIPTAATACPASPDDALDFLASAGLPIVMKGADRYVEDQTSTTIIHSRQGLMDELGRREAAGGPLNVVLQEYIPGDVDTVWMCNGYFPPTPGQAVIFTGKKLRQLSVSGIASLAICLPNETVATQTQRFMEAVGYRGCVGIGYRYDRRDGLYKVLDVNPRVSGVFRLFVGTNDMDVVRACYLGLTGQQLPKTALQPGRKWMLEDHYFFAERTGLRIDHLRIAEWIRSVRGVRESHWFAADDPVPMVMWLRKWVRWRASDVVKRMRTMPVRTHQLQASTERETELRQQLDQVRTSEAELRRLLDQTRSALGESEASLQALHQTRAWRVITRWWRLKLSVKRVPGG